MADEQTRRALFRKMAFDPSEWRKSAQNLRYSANLLEPEIELFWQRLRNYFERGGLGRPGCPHMDAYYLLWGYAIENLLKACVVAVKGATLKEQFDSGQGKRLPDPLAHHRMRKIAADAELPLSKIEEVLLFKLEVHVQYGGKYPTPLKYTEHPSQPNVPGATEQELEARLPEDIAAFRALYERLWAASD